MTTAIRASGLLLDMDGTLVDSTPVVERVWREWSAAHGLDPAEVLSVVHGRQSHESMAILLPDRSHAENMADHRAMLARETAETEGIVEIPGAASFLAALARLPHALVTSATDALARARLAAAGLDAPEKAIMAEHVSASKPDPEGFLAGAAALGLPPAGCVAFEDSPAGIAAARAAGMRVVGIGEATRELGADWSVRDLAAVRVEADGGEIVVYVDAL
ncbi:HAD-IA family hydrolase [Microbacterium sp. gxy059]|uniref:HAD-IA family hydrolase n=1 Tax=Microbacterium sp. gxy059 TaxID=2957199 RepID=UPI003D954C3B